MFVYITPIITHFPLFVLYKSILFTVEEGRQSKNTLATIRELVAKEGSYVYNKQIYFKYVTHTLSRINE